MPIAPNEVQRLIDLASAEDQGRCERVLFLRDRAICEVFYASAIRVSELISARLCDLSLERRLLIVLGKGSKTRLVPLGVSAVRALESYLQFGRPYLEKATSPFLFIGKCGTLTRQAVWFMLNQRSKEAGISHVSPHMFRHSCATHMVANGADLRTVQTILGHADISTTQIYTKVDREHVKKVCARFHPRWHPRRKQMPLFQSAPVLPGFVICSDCTNLALPEKTRCELHLRKGNEAVKRNRERRTNHEAMEQASRLRGPASGKRTVHEMPREALSA